MNDLILLAALRAGPKHGYALKKLAGFMAGQKEMHNNLVYPLLRRFMENGWVAKRTVAGDRGQERDLYSLTAKGKASLAERLAHFTEKEARSETEFRVRAGLFGALEPGARTKILAERDQWLARHQERLEKLQDSMVELKADEWGHATMRLTLQQVHLERNWIAEMSGKGASSPKRASRTQRRRRT